MSSDSLFRIDLALRKTLGAKMIAPRDVLQFDGPRLSVTVGLHARIENARAAKGLPLPFPVTGLALIDTGAAVTTIHISVANALGLQPIGPVSSHGIGGSTDGFAASCSIKMRDERVSLLGVHCLDVPAMLNSGIIGLIGRDILRDLILHYDGVSGAAYLERPAPPAPPVSTVRKPKKRPKNRRRSR